MATQAVNRRRVRIAVTLAIASLIFLPACDILAGKQIQKKGMHPPGRVYAVTPLPLSATVAAIWHTFNNWEDFIAPASSRNFQNRFPPESRWGAFFLFAKGDAAHPLFPSDDEIRLDSYPDAGLQEYVALAPERRARDLYLYEPTGDVYWSSEYFDRGNPVKFRCGFLIHLEPEQGSATRIEIFEYQPTIWDGEKFGWSAHGVLPGMVYDIRTAEPTTTERQEILQLIQRSAK